MIQCNQGKGGNTNDRKGNIEDFMEYYTREV